MKIEIHTINGIRIAEISSNTLLISDAEAILQIMIDVYYQDTDRIILYEKNISPAFFDLKTGIAGEILQKFSNYRMKLAIVGEFETYTQGSLRDFIRESNRQGQINFVVSREEALEKLLRN